MRRDNSSQREEKGLSPFEHFRLLNLQPLLGTLMWCPSGSLAARLN
jgi:hypothetical protein